jgi:hypothetical protein
MSYNLKNLLVNILKRNGFDRKVGYVTKNENVRQDFSKTFAATIPSSKDIFKAIHRFLKKGDNNKDIDLDLTILR